MLCLENFNCLIVHLRQIEKFSEIKNEKQSKLKVKTDVIPSALSAYFYINLMKKKDVVI